jgi:hypothetical protein
MSDLMLGKGFGRRAILSAGIALPLILLPGCAQSPGLNLTEVIRRLLTISSQRALAALMAPGGFYDNQVARLTLPDQLGGRSGNILTAILTSGAVRDRLLRQINRAAEKGAERAAPIVAETIRTMPVVDALAILHGGGSAATDLLRGQMGNALVSAMVPGIDEGLRLFDSEIVTQALRAATGIDFTGLRDDVTRKAADAIYAQIGREEAAIRANPQSTNDALLIAALTLAGR